MRSIPLVLVALAASLALPVPSLATNPDGPVGSMALSFSWRGMYTWDASFSGLGQTIQAEEVGLVDRGGNEMFLGFIFPAAPYVSILGSYNRLSFEDKDRIEDPDLGTFILTSDASNHWVSIGARFYIPFTAAAKAELKSSAEPY